MEVAERASCRACGSTSLADVLSLGDQRIAGAFPRAGEPDPPRLPLELVRCADGCGLVQLRHTVAPEALYSSYGYRSGINATMTANLREIAEQAFETARPEPGDVVLDIGCNDGTLLDTYGPRVQRVGFDPSDVARYAEGRGHRIVRDFFSHSAAESIAGQDAKIITSIAMFYDLDDPQRFVSEVAATLHRTGVWVLELHYLPLMLKRNQFDAICHEHLGYYALGTIEPLLDAAKLRVVRASTNDVNGGSIRLFVRHTRAGLGPSREDAMRLFRLRQAEGRAKLESPEPYARFAQNVERIRDELRDLCQRASSWGTIHAYGASTKGNVILQYADLDASVIPCAADRNPDKHGSRTSTGIPIISEDESRAMRPDYYLALPWHFLPEFLVREREFLDRGGKFITPLPEVSTISCS